MTTKKESKPYFITEEVFSQIRESIGSCIPETGGILGSSDGKHIDYFYFDKTANVTGATYEPDCNELNPVIRRWHEKGIEFVGFIHSHPRGAIKPSNPDNLYTKKIMKALDNIAELQEQELRLVGVREKLSRFIEALESFNAEPTFDSATWNSLVERVLVNPRNLIFEFKNGEKIKISI